MKIGQTLSVIDVGAVPEEYREEFQAKLAKLQNMAPTVAVQGHEEGHRAGPRREARRRLRRLRRGGDRRRLDRPGLPRDAARRPRRRGQGAVPGHQGRRPRRPAERRPRAEAARPHRARPRHQGGRRRAARADHRGARLRARGGEPPRAGARVPRPPVHRRPRGDQRPVPRARDRHRVHRGPALRRDPRRLRRGALALGRDPLPLLRQRAVPAPPAQRRPAPGQLAVHARRPRRVPRLRLLQAPDAATRSRCSSRCCARSTRRTPRRSTRSPSARA